MEVEKRRRRRKQMKEKTLPGCYEQNLHVRLFDSGQRFGLHMQDLPKCVSLETNPL
jgi:hypothetical protein